VTAKLTAIFEQNRFQLLR